MLIKVTIVVFILATLVQLYYWLVVFRRLVKYPLEEENAAEKEGLDVSIIICAQNEAENLKKNLPRILNQNYRSFEVIVVNDNSTDTSNDILLNFIINNPILRTINLREKPKGRIGKKYALAKGIAAAKHEVLLLTDADCSPNSTEWLQNMQQKIRGSVEIGLGYGPYNSHPGFLNKFIRYETFYTALQYFSLALAGLPYMGVGRNLIYKKRLFERAGGFQKHDKIASGDDDLFINAVAHADNTTILLSPTTFCYSEPKRTWTQYYKQKSRHLSTGKHYTAKNKLILGLFSLSHFTHFLGGIVLIVKFSTIFVIVLYVVRISSVMWTSRPLISRLREASLWKWIPILDFAFFFYYGLFAPVLMTGNTDQWK